MGVKIYVLVSNIEGEPELIYNPKIIEVSDPLNPVLISSIVTDDHVTGIGTMKILDKIYVLVIQYSSLKIIDVSDP